MFNFFLFFKELLLQFFSNFIFLTELPSRSPWRNSGTETRSSSPTRAPVDIPVARSAERDSGKFQRRSFQSGRGRFVGKVRIISGQSSPMQKPYEEEMKKKMDEKSSI